MKTKTILAMTRCRCPRAGLLAFLCAAVTLARVSAADPALQADHDHYYPGQDIVVSFSSGPGNTKDWIGVYPPDATPGPVASTIWRYVDGTQAGNQGLREGSITFPGGLALAGDWAAYLLLNDGYTQLATNLFQVIDPSFPLVQADQRLYAAGGTISISFTNGPANPKDWIGVYLEGQTPGSVDSTIWFYTDGTKAGNTGKPDGVVTFATGLATPGNYVAYLLANDGYDILSSESFTVAAASGGGPRVLLVAPADGSSNQPPQFRFTATITNTTSHVVLNSVVLKLDDVAVAASATETNGLVTVTYAGEGLPAAGSTHHWSLTARDDAALPNPIQASSHFTVGSYRNVVLPTPLYFESFDDLTEGALPAGWTDASYSSPLTEGMNFADLGSAAYAHWTVVGADRFTGVFGTYDNPEAADTDYRRVLRVNPFNVLNGKVYDQPLAQGRFLFGNSGYQNGSASQVMIVFTRDYDLTGKTNVHLAFKSLWEQNQDSIGAIEYSINKGASWLPVAYFLDGRDIVTVTDETTGVVSVDAETTLTTEQSDVARYTDDQGNEIGGTYGAFIAAPISAALAPYLQARVDDNPVESKRIEYFPLPEAGGKSTVRFRIVHAGTDSWYFGIDDFGLYQISEGGEASPTLTLAREGKDAVISWGTASGYTLESSATLGAANWEPVAGVTGASHRVTASAAAAFYRLRK